MRKLVEKTSLPDGALLITCSSHEERSHGFFRNAQDWQPGVTILFHYDDENPRRERNHNALKLELERRSCIVHELQFKEQSAAVSIKENADFLRHILKANSDRALVFDMSVFTKRHMLMMLRWLDDHGYWDHLSVVYSEPEDYDVSEFVHLSFGLSSVRPIPGFPSVSDLSRPLHLVLFLGYEGDRAFATYEYVQPIDTTLIIASPAYKVAWEGRTEAFNQDLIAVVGESNVERMSGTDPEEVELCLASLFENGENRDEMARIICPIGTKPQTLGVYSFIRKSADPPSLIYASPLRHNHGMFSHGIGDTWLLKEGIKK